MPNHVQDSPDCTVNDLTAKGPFLFPDPFSLFLQLPSTICKSPANSIAPSDLSFLSSLYLGDNDSNGELSHAFDPLFSSPYSAHVDLLPPITFPSPGEIRVQKMLDSPVLWNPIGITVRQNRQYQLKATCSSPSKTAADASSDLMSTTLSNSIPQSISQSKERPTKSISAILAVYGPPVFSPDKVKLPALNNKPALGLEFALTHDNLFTPGFSSHSPLTTWRPHSPHIVTCCPKERHMTPARAADGSEEWSIPYGRASPKKDKPLPCRMPYNTIPLPAETRMLGDVTPTKSPSAVKSRT